MCVIPTTVAPDIAFGTLEGKTWPMKELHTAPSVQGEIEEIPCHLVPHFSPRKLGRLIPQGLIKNIQGSTVKNFMGS